MVLPVGAILRGGGNQLRRDAQTMKNKITPIDVDTMSLAVADGRCDSRTYNCQRQVRLQRYPIRQGGEPVSSFRYNPEMAFSVFISLKVHTVFAVMTFSDRTARVYCNATRLIWVLPCSVMMSPVVISALAAGISALQGFFAGQ